MLWMLCLAITACYGSNAFGIQSNGVCMLPQPIRNTTGLDGGLPVANQRCGRPVAREGTTP